MLGVLYFLQEVASAYAAAISITLLTTRHLLGVNTWRDSCLSVGLFTLFADALWLLLFAVVFIAKSKDDCNEDNSTMMDTVIVIVINSIPRFHQQYWQILLLSVSLGLISIHNCYHYQQHYRHYFCC